MEENKLKKALTAAGIWSVAVGAVISGSYYGWNYIASETNFTGCLIAMAIATLFYIPFAFMFAELATAIPRPRSLHRKGIWPRRRLLRRLQLSC